MYVQLMDIKKRTKDLFNDGFLAVFQHAITIEVKKQKVGF